jgi:hypothetical protein
LIDGTVGAIPIPTLQTNDAQSKAILQLFRFLLSISDSRDAVSLSSVAAENYFLEVQANEGIHCSYLCATVRQADTN